jgi:alpha-tubulin suppressor-like RCC1 family protein
VGCTDKERPKLITTLANHTFITMVSCGQNHSVALTDRGQLYSWGSSRFGQCGQGGRGDVKVPTEIRIESYGTKFVDISCGDTHSVALTSEGDVYAFGCGKHGQLGLGGSVAMILRPTFVEDFRSENIVSAVCGAIHTAFINDAGEVFCVGFGEHFYANEDNFSYRPAKIEFDKKVVQVACGQVGSVCVCVCVCW